VKATSGARCLEVSQQGYLLFRETLRERSMLSLDKRSDAPS
jgi:hypothetical protein